MKTRHTMLDKKIKCYYKIILQLDSLEDFFFKDPSLIIILN